MELQLACRISCSLFPGESWHLQPEYMIPDRLPWRHWARPSATLHEIGSAPKSKLVDLILLTSRKGVKRGWVRGLRQAETT